MKRKLPTPLITNHAAAPTRNRASSQNFKINAAATRHATFEGRDHLVAPVIAVREGVLNGMLVLYDEFSAYPQAWEGVPLPIYHPQKGQTRVTANTPDVLEKQVAGRMFNVAADPTTKSLKGELWIDVEKAKTLTDGPEIIRRLEAGENLEVSTGYYSDLELTAGVHDGKAYDSIQRNMRPDHVAMLPGKIGACSWADGCGAPRLNAAVKYLLKDAAGAGLFPVTNDAGEPDQQRMTAALSQLNHFDGPGKVKALVKLKGMFKKLNVPLPTVNCMETNFCLSSNQDEYSHDDIAMMLREALAEEDPASYYYLQDVYDDFAIYMAEPKLYIDPPVATATNGLYKRAYSILDGAVTLGAAIPVVRQTSYVEVQNEEKPNMDKKAIVDRLITSAETSWKEEHRPILMTINEAELTKLLPPDPAAVAAAAAAEAATAARKVIVDKLIIHASTPWKEENRAILMAVNTADLEKLLPAEVVVPAKSPAFATAKDFLEAIPDPAIRRVIEQGMASNQLRHTELVTKLVAHKACKFTEPELKAMDVDFLEKVADSLSVTFVGQAPPRTDRARAGVETNDGVPQAPRFLTRPVETATK